MPPVDPRARESKKKPLPNESSSLNPLGAPTPLTLIGKGRVYGIIRVRGEPSERLIPSLGVDMGPGGNKFFIIFISFAGPRAGPLYFDTQAPRRPRPTRKVTPCLGLEVLLVKHQDLAVAGGC